MLKKISRLKAGLCTLLFLTSLAVGCSSQQLGSAAYGSFEARECKNKTSSPACDLDERSMNQRLINGAPDQHSTQALLKQLEKQHKSK